MKKVLAFLVLFGAGLFALWWFERPERPVDAGDPLPPVEPGEPERPPVTGIELQGKFEGKGKGKGVRGDAGSVTQGQNSRVTPVYRKCRALSWPSTIASPGKKTP